ncbi:MAG: hypothetical protein HY898_06160 [Deltaproteobacteria bacterium]|nr:hypothetical protein [Deltaproteobacteria bacterium]
MISGLFQPSPPRLAAVATALYRLCMTCFARCNVVARTVAIALSPVLAACSSSSSPGEPVQAPADSGAEDAVAEGDASVVPDAAKDGDASDAAVDEAAGDSPSPQDALEAEASDADSGPPPSALPFVYERPDVGTPLTQAELDTATDELIALLADTRYFDVVDERVHGWPETDPGGKYWYGTWWSGVQVIKSAGKVTYLHSADGADNNGLRTAPLLEGACYATQLWGQPQQSHLVRRIVRGFSSWALAMVRQPNDTAPTMLTRASYPVSVESTEGGRNLTIDYSLNRPGVDNGATEYVHLPDNPTWGDLWIKNKRSKDDIGHMFRAIGQIQPCASQLGAQGAKELDDMRELYASWSRRVEDDAFSIATWDKGLQLYIPPITETLAHYTLLGNVECVGALAIRLLGRGDSGTLNCGGGISDAEKLAGTQLNGSAKQILRTHHEAAVNMALWSGNDDVALALLQGLTVRVETDLGALESANPPANVNKKDVAALLLHASNAGVPLTSHEVRWLHQRIHEAYTTYRDPGQAATFKVFDPATPDGTYPYQPEGDGLAFIDIGVLLGSCAAPYRNPSTRPLLSCAKLLALP